MSDLGTLNDPWVAPDPTQGGQSGRIKAFCKVVVAGFDITSRLEPYLLSVEVHDGASDGHGFWAQIELDDREGQLPIPPFGSPVSITLGWVGGESRMFNFTISYINSSFQRSGGSGRHLTIVCNGAHDQFSLQKTPMNDHLGEGAPPGSEIGEPSTLGQWLSQVASNAGGSAYVHPDLGGITRDYWAMAGESPIHHFNRLAQEFGAVTRIESGNNFIMTKSGEQWDGSDPPTVTAQWGVNLIAWRIYPWVDRSTWVSSEHEYFDAIQGQWSNNQKSFDLPAPFGSGMSMFKPPAPAPNSQAAYQRNDGVDNQVSYRPGDGLVTLNGEPAAAWNGHVQVIGARPGVDGLYLIREAEHTYSRAGFVTYLTVSPYGGAPAGLASANAQLVSSAFTQPAGTAPAVPFNPTADEWAQLTAGVTYPPNPGPASAQPAPAPATPPAGEVTIGTPTVTDGQ